MMSKKGMELSINFMVMLILAIAVFGGGLMLMRKMFSSANDIKQSLSAQQESEIQNMLVNNNDRVVLPFSKKEVKRNGHTVFGLGINNMLREGMSGSGGIDTFKIDVKFSIAKFVGGEVCSNWADCGDGQNPDDYITLLTEEFEIPKNNQKIVEIPVIIPKAAKRGSYTYNINISYDNNGNYDSYDTIKRITVDVD